MNDLQIYKNNCIEAEQFLNPLPIREKVLDMVKNNQNFSDDDLEFIAMAFPDILLNNMEITKESVMAWVRVHKYIRSHMFPESIYKEEDLMDYILEYTESIPCEAIRHITIDNLKKYSCRHSDLDFYQLCDIVDRSKDDTIIRKAIKKDDFLHQKYKHGKKEYDKRMRSNFQVATTDDKESTVINICDLNIKDEIINHEPEYIVQETSHTNKIMKLKNNEVIFYISDLHLTYKIQELVKNGCTINEASQKIITKAILDIYLSYKHLYFSFESLGFYAMMVIAGDLSYDFNVNKAFYTLLKKELPYTDIVVVLGNHELWPNNSDDKTSCSLQTIRSEYKKLFKELGIIYLENDVFLRYGDYKVVIPQIDIAHSSPYLKDIFNKYDIAIFGCTGYAGLNENFNSENGLYKESLIDRNEERRLSEESSATFDQVIRYTDSQRLVCISHMPHSDWYQGKQNIENIVFINGHTHRSYYSPDKPTIYADNQVGYKNDNYSLKYCILDTKFNIFDSLEDGIHQISPVDYIEFLRGINRDLPKINGFKNLKLYLIKKDGIMMFIGKSNKGTLYIYNGGAKSKLKKTEIDYYHQNLTKVSDIVFSSFGPYKEAMKEISSAITQLGGSGNVHGCIVDIDFTNKLYVNPYDGKITAYSAPEIYSSKRIIYGSLYNMISNNQQCDCALKRIKTNYDNNDSKYPIVKANNIEDFASIVTSSKTKDFRKAYSMSRSMNKIDSLFEDNILKIWPDEVDKAIEKSNKQKQKCITSISSKQYIKQS